MQLELEQSCLLQSLLLHLTWQKGEHLHAQTLLNAITPFQNQAFALAPTEDLFYHLTAADKTAVLAVG